MRVHAFCLFALGLAPIVHGKKNHIDIQTLDLTPADISADGNLLECNDGVHMDPGSSFVIQTPRYPKRYPNGPKGRDGADGLSTSREMQLSTWSVISSK